MAEKLELSEFIANQELDLHYHKTAEGLQPCSSLEKDAVNIKLKKKDKIPVLFIPSFLEHNRNFLENLPEKDGLPYLTPEQSKKYGVEFGKKSPKVKKYAIFTAEKLMQKWKKLGDEKFKAWAEKTFGEDQIDKRMSPRNIIVEIGRIVG